MTNKQANHIRQTMKREDVRAGAKVRQARADAYVYDVYWYDGDLLVTQSPRHTLHASCYVRGKNYYFSVEEVA